MLNEVKMANNFSMGLGVEYMKTSQSIIIGTSMGNSMKMFAMKKI